MREREPGGVELVSDALRNYHFALDMHQPAVAAAQACVAEIEKVLDMPWVQGAEMSRRQARVTPEKELPKQAES